MLAASVAGWAARLSQHGRIYQTISLNRNQLARHPSLNHSVNGFSQLGLDAWTNKTTSLQQPQARLGFR